jgi:hypothetical protein
MTPDQNTDLSAVPIACTLSAAEFTGRKAETAEIARDALRSRRPIEHGSLLTFAADADTERQLRDIVAAEAQCCAFLRMDLRRAGEALELEVTGPDEARPIIEELFA